MHRAVLLFGLVLSIRSGFGACPPDCVDGGGPPSGDCVVTWGGIASTTATCVDGEACDQDGVPDGICTFPLSACLGADAACGVTAVSAARVTPRKSPASFTLASAIAALAPGQCTSPGFPVPVKWRPGSPGPLKDGKARLRVTVNAGGQKDSDVLTLICQPARPALSTTIQPLFTQHCATAGCHAGVAPQVPTLEAGASYAAVVGQPATDFRSKGAAYVEPGNTRRSWMVTKLLGLKRTTRMPSACPTPGTPCLTDEETYAILAWIQAGAPDD